MRATRTQGCCLLHSLLRPILRLGQPHLLLTRRLSHSFLSLAAAEVFGLEATKPRKACAHGRVYLRRLRCGESYVCAHCWCARICRQRLIHLRSSCDLLCRRVHGILRGTLGLFLLYVGVQSTLLRLLIRSVGTCMKTHWRFSQALCLCYADLVLYRRYGAILAGVPRVQ